VSTHPSVDSRAAARARRAREDDCIERRVFCLHASPRWTVSLGQRTRLNGDRSMDSCDHAGQVVCGMSWAFQFPPLLHLESSKLSTLELGAAPSPACQCPVSARLKLSAARAKNQARASSSPCTRSGMHAQLELWPLRSARVSPERGQLGIGALHSVHASKAGQRRRSTSGSPSRWPTLRSKS
jgi:hypothetical protein